MSEAGGGRREVVAKLRKTFGPALVGLLGGAATAFLLVPSASSVLTNMAVTYDKFPSEPQPWFVGHWNPSPGFGFAAGILGVLLPILTGLGVVLIARPRDTWETISAGLTAALASTLSSFGACIGWMVTIALVVVPSIIDLSTVCDASVPPPDATALNPADTLANLHPDLQDVAANERAKRMFPKLISDLCAGSIRAVWVGLLEAVSLCGMVTFLGTLTAGYLLGRPDRRWLGVLISYVELTVPATLCFNAAIFKLLLPGVGPEVGWSQVLAVICMTGVLIGVAFQRGHWLVRVALALLWFFFLARAVNGSPLWIGEAVAPLLLGLHFLHQRRQATPAPVPA